MPNKILLLGGTTEARELAELLANLENCDAVVSLAGLTTFPAAYAAPIRIGGFGGVEGLIRYLEENGIDLVIDATHPFAQQMSANAIEATRRAKVPLVRLKRECWMPTPQDKWTVVDNVDEAINVLGRKHARSVFLPLGRKELLKFEAAPRHRYLIRSVEPVVPPLKVPKVTYLEGRPPFDKASEAALMKKHAIEVMVLKNSGGSAAYAKLIAARELGVEVIMISRPPEPGVVGATSVAEVFAIVVHELGLRPKRVA